MGQPVLSRVTLVVNGAARCGCVYTSATWGVPIHIYLSVPDVRKQYTGFQNCTSPCFMYAACFLKMAFISKIFRLKVEKDFDFQKTNTTRLILNKSSKTGYQYTCNYIRFASK